MKIETPLGELKFSFSVAGNKYLESTRDFVLLSETYSPQLPEGMSVLGCAAVVLRINTSKIVSEITFQCSWVANHNFECSIETGEGLEAQAWENEEYTVMIGTEDEESLSRILPEGAILSCDSDLVEYSDSGMSINASQVYAGSELYLHFIVSWNKLPESEDSSCWYAVHKDVTVIEKMLEVNKTLQ